MYFDGIRGAYRREKLPRHLFIMELDYFRCNIRLRHYTRLCWASFVSSRHDATHICCRSPPAFAARRPQRPPPPIDRYLLPNPPAALLLSIDETEKTDRLPTVTWTLLCILCGQSQWNYHLGRLRTTCVNHCWHTASHALYQCWLNA